MSQKQNKRQEAKEKRLQEERKLAQKEKNKQFLLMGAVAGALVLVVIIAIFITGGSSSSGDLNQVDEIEASLENIPQSGNTLGEDSAPVTITELGDLQCPSCAAFAVDSLPEVIDGPVQSGDAKIEFQNWAILGPDSEIAGQAALAAAEQDKLWQFIEIFYNNQGVENSGYAAEDEYLTSVARAAGLDVDQWNEDRINNAKQLDEEVADSEELADQEGFTGTPSFVIEGPSGQKSATGILSADEIIQLVDSVK